MSSFEYIVRTVFVHFDDSNVAIQKAAEEVLRTAAAMNKEEFLKVVCCGGIERDRR